MNKSRLPARLRNRFSFRDFDNSDAYYEAAAKSHVNKGFHDFAMRVAFAGMRLRDGRLRMIIPKEVRDLNGRPSIFGSLHRSKSDIPIFVQITEAAGFHYTRPLAKKEYFRRPITGIPFAEWGAVPVDRKNPNLDGINRYGAAALAAGYSLELFTGGTRIKPFDAEGNPVDTRKAEKPKRTAGILAVQNQVPLIPMAIAGVAEDDKRWVSGLGKPVVAVLGAPIMPELWTPDMVRADRLLFQHAGDVSRELHRAQQAALDLAYLIREA